MAAPSRSKHAQRALVIKKLPALIKKHCEVVVPRLQLPVLETMLYAVCLENVPASTAEAAYQRISQLFPDLNEARVSTISELEPIFAGIEDPDLRAFRLRAVLQYVFDKHYTFELESLRKKTFDIASRQLSKIRHITPFIRNFTLHQVLGVYLIPLDEATLHALEWLGLVNPGQTLEEAGESLKGLVRKAEVHTFCYTLRALATDPRWKPHFLPPTSAVQLAEGVATPENEDDDRLETALDRLTGLLTGTAPTKRHKASRSTPRSAATRGGKNQRATSSGEEKTRRRSAKSSR
ncbi:MAG: hypothetical protein KatS3mg114_0986 [Planctomycetaceae bacterium]|nr:MAG: hypothetical protein KatS3mg114_0986 [Planctomycetaceae bacterium]